MPPGTGVSRLKSKKSGIMTQANEYQQVAARSKQYLINRSFKNCLFKNILLSPPPSSVVSERLFSAVLQVNCFETKKISAKKNKLKWLYWKSLICSFLIFHYWLRLNLSFFHFLRKNRTIRLESGEIRNRISGKVITDIRSHSKPNPIQNFEFLNLMFKVPL